MHTTAPPRTDTETAAAAKLLPLEILLRIITWLAFPELERIAAGSKTLAEAAARVVRGRWRRAAVYFSGARGLHAVSLADGSRQWEPDWNGSSIASSATPMEDGSLAFFAGRDNCVHAVDCATGLRVWASIPMDGIRSAKGITLLHSGHGHGHGHDSGRGNGNGNGGNGPRVRLVVGGSGGHVYCLDAATGAQCWRSQHPGASGPWVNMPPALSPDGSLVYFGSCDTRVYAASADSGRTRWRSGQLGEQVTSSPVLSSDGRRVYVCVEMEGVVALETGPASAEVPPGARAVLHTATAADQPGTGTGTGTGICRGRELWRLPFESEWARTGDGFYHSLCPVLSHDDATLYVGASDWHLYAIDARTGCVRWRHQTGGETFCCSPALSPDGSTVVCCSNDRPAPKRVHAIDAQTGALRWKSAIADGHRLNCAPAISPDGALVVVGSAGGAVRCLAMRDGALRWQYDTPRGPGNNMDRVREVLQDQCIAIGRVRGK